MLKGKKILKTLNNPVSKKISILAIIITTLITSLVGFIYTANKAVPTSILYPADLALEQVQRVLTFTPRNKILFDINLLKERLTELNEIIQEKAPDTTINSSLYEVRNQAFVLKEEIRENFNNLSDKDKKLIIEKLQDLSEVSHKVMFNLNKDRAEKGYVTLIKQVNTTMNRMHNEPKHKNQQNQLQQSTITPSNELKKTSKVQTNKPTTDIPEEAKTLLRNLYETIKLQRDLNTTFYDKWNLKCFETLSLNNQIQLDLTKKLMQHYNVQVTSTAVGRFNSPKFNKTFLTYSDQGLANLNEAFITSLKTSNMQKSIVQQLNQNNSFSKSDLIQLNRINKLTSANEKILRDAESRF